MDLDHKRSPRLPPLLFPCRIGVSGCYRGFFACDADEEFEYVGCRSEYEVLSRLREKTRHVVMRLGEYVRHCTLLRAIVISGFHEYIHRRSTDRQWEFVLGADDYTRAAPGRARCGRVHGLAQTIWFVMSASERPKDTMKNAVTNLAFTVSPEVHAQCDNVVDSWVRSLVEQCC